MPRLQDILFGILCVALVALTALHFGVVALALLGAFACGAIYLFLGMLPSRNESFWHRIFVTVFLSFVLSSIVLIVPGTFGPQAVRPGAVIAVAGLIPLTAICFEVLRTPRVIQGILWCLGYR